VCSFCTCNSSVRRSAFLSVGGFDENFEGASYGDDYDFAVRLARAGGQIVFDPTCEVVHLRAPLGGLRYADKQNEFAERDKALSGLLFCLRYWNEYKRWHMIYHYVLRRTVLRRDSVMRPTRLPAVLAGLARAYRDARRAAKEGPRSRFA
jgi:GT2 family glycosyltransferase